MCPTFVPLTISPAGLHLDGRPCGHHHRPARHQHPGGRQHHGAQSQQRQTPGQGTVPGHRRGGPRSHSSWPCVIALHHATASCPCSPASCPFGPASWCSATAARADSWLKYGARGCHPRGGPLSCTSCLCFLASCGDSASLPCIVPLHHVPAALHHGAQSQQRQTFGQGESCASCEWVALRATSAGG